MRLECTIEKVTEVAAKICRADGGFVPPVPSRLDPFTLLW